jgi:hypothetical protein
MTRTRNWLGALAIGSLAALTPSAGMADPIISPGTPISSNADLPPYLTDGSYLFGIMVSLAPGEILLPIGIAGATNLQNWQFDLLFDSTVVNEVDPLDGTSGIYGAEFTLGDLTSLSFILSGFPDNSSGQVGTVAGSYPSLLKGPSGDGALAFVLFRCLDQENCTNPNFSVGGTQVGQAAPEPSTLLLLAIGLLLFDRQRLTRREKRT